MALHNPAGQAGLVSSLQKTQAEKLPQGFMHAGAGKETEAGVLASSYSLPPFPPAIGFSSDAPGRTSLHIFISEGR